MVKTLKEPTLEEKRELRSIELNQKDYVTVRGHKWGYRWTRREACNKVTDILQAKVKDEKRKYVDESKVTCKSAAAFRLNGYFMIKLFYWFLWRWYYYVREYGDFELQPFIELAQKKTPQDEYYAVTISLIGFQTANMMKSREEADRILQELSTGKTGK
jgi:hypothetical protein